jgi:predicted ABC-class ATPase
MLCKELPAIVAEGLLWRNADQPAAQRFVGTVENYHAIRERLAGHGLIAFVADGSVLPRESGASDLPLAREDSVAFASCDPYRIMMPIPNEVSGAPGGPSSITGLGIRQGVTLIVGGGYHGKSTLLKALERGVYPHVPGDGREYVITDPRAVKIRAEDGRRVERVDISSFIDNLPHGRDTAAFCTDDASGSTSQAANIVEAIEAGATTLLLDEDTCATNFMVRDARMQALVAKENEPITPFLDRVRELYDTAGVSTVLVMGGCGDYFDVADTVFQMNRYVPSDATEAARRVAQSHPTGRRAEAASTLKRHRYRIPDASTLDPSRGHRDARIDADGVDALRFGNHTIDLHHIDQLVDRLQTLAIGQVLVLARNRWMKSKPDVNALLDHIESTLDETGLDVLDPWENPGTHPGCFARPRRFEIVAALNRLRTLHVEVK